MRLREGITRRVKESRDLRPVAGVTSSGVDPR